MSNVTINELKNQITVSTTENTIEVKSPGTIGAQGSAGEISSATVSASAVAVDGSGNSQAPTVAITLGGTTYDRTMAFAFGLPTGKSGVIQSITTTGTDGIEIDAGGTMNTATNTLTLGVHAQNLWSHILANNVTGTALTITDGSNATNLALEGTITYSAVANETTVAQSGGTVTVGLVDNPVVSGITAGNLKVGVTGDNEIDTSSGNLTLDSAGGTVTVDDNLTVTGNLTVSGTTTNISTTQITVEDSLISLGSENTEGDSIDLGWYGTYDDGGTDKYAGMHRDAGDGTFNLFKDLEVQPSSIVDMNATGYTKATLQAHLVGEVSGDVTGDVTGDLTGNADTVTNGVTTTNSVTIGGTKTFSNIIVGSINGNAATVTTNANLSGDVTSSGNVTTIADLAMSKTALVAGTGLTLSTNTLNVDAFQLGITRVGTLTHGEWTATAIADAYIDSASTWNAKITGTGVTFENLNTNSDVGTGASQVAQGNHNHDTAYDGLGNGVAMAIALG